jgi:hypothetical protein
MSAARASSAADVSQIVHVARVASAQKPALKGAGCCALA